MNNLLRTLTDSQLAQEPDLKLLLNNVKEARRQCHDTKLSDAFYDSLDGLLQDVRLVTMDNRDAEAFLKPVSKSEVPDYYDVIREPMDLQTMQKKVKQKAYKSKKEFKDDLDLIWQNCLTYNATENHPLRQCALRLKAKAEKLLKNITDRRERLDPPLPSDISRGGTPKLNGNGLNGHAVARSRSIAFTKSPSPSKPLGTATATARRDAQFPDQPAIVRTAEGMAEWLHLDQELDARLNGELLANGFSGPSVEEKLFDFVGMVPDLRDEDAMSVDGEVGEKRKLTPENRSRKRARTGSPEKDAVEMWWDALRSDFMLGNGLPVLTHAASEPPSSSSAPKTIVDPPRKGGARPRKKRRKGAGTDAQKTMLWRMNDNIRTLRRVREVHARLTVLKDAADDPSGESGFLVPPPPVEELDDPVDDRPWSIPAAGIDVGEENADGCMHWMSSKVLEHAGFQGTSKVALDVLAGVASDYLLNVGRNLQFLTEKYANKMTAEEIILHTLFESGVTRAPYDLERYIKEDVVRYGNRMNDLEKKLSHAYSEATADQAWDDEALFGPEENEEEDGEFVMGNFADAFGEDFLGLRELGIAAEFGLSSLSVPKKLLKGKKPGEVPGAVSVKKPSEPPPPFPPPPPFVQLDSAFVEDQIGLLKPYYHHRMAQLVAAAPPPPPPPVPQLPPFSLQSPRTFPQAPYQPSSSSVLPSAPMSAGPPVPPLALAPAVHDAPALPPVILPDDPPTAIHTKLGPLGQVLKPSASASAAKKKDKAPAKGKGPADGAGPAVPAMFAGAGEDGTPAATPVATAPETPKKPKPTPTKKKKGPGQPQNGLEALPPPILASG
ncbi:hypothetical protein PsYK624_144300 [Phanerochaete sordida]|uniref:Bromo domain-containing protein n=1 Tax=Phanerochaete sordida TaxID=48140 RepID=A0A9P3GMN3_9APHY|nr:hypothetical protein PsYK624_144300 [Phanerochaete sordida]